MAELVDGLAPLLRPLIGEQVEVEVAHDRCVGRVLADPAQLEQVVLNLAVNARDAMPSGGRLRISTGPALLASDPEVAAVRLAVRDSGCGIDPATAERIFEPFFTTKGPERGTGLGLATVRRIVDGLGGRIAVSTAPGAGAEFIIDIPVASDEEAVGTGGLEAAGLGAGERVLVVEDDSALLDFVVRGLRALGYAADGVAGAEGAEAWLAGHDADLLLADVQLRGSLGTSLAVGLVKDRPGMAALLMTGLQGDLGDSGPGASSFPVIRKPFTPAAVAAAVRAALDGREARCHP